MPRSCSFIFHQWDVGTYFHKFAEAYPVCAAHGCMSVCWRLNLLYSLQQIDDDSFRDHEN